MAPTNDPPPTASLGDAGEVAKDELRLALVLNGGVSLAVWISGVVSEIDVLRRADASAPPDPDDVTAPVYAALLKALRVDARVDVVAGASAGGLNGALLAAHVAMGTPFRDVRGVWMTLGQLGDLVRNVSEPDPPSLLDGEKRFYAPLADQLSKRLEGTDGLPESDLSTGIRAILVGTDITGVDRTMADSYHGKLLISEHRLRFRFGHEPSADYQLDDGWAELRPDTAATKPAEIANALARAARTSSSFPFAFDPSHLDATSTPVLRDATVTRDGRHVLRTAAPRRWAMDGGVLDNSPIGAVLETIMAQPATAADADVAGNGMPPNVKRAVVFVVPYADDPERRPSREMPSLATVLDTTFNMPRDVAITDHLEELDAYLHGRRRSHATARELLRLPGDCLRCVARELYAAFREQRAATTVAELAVRYRCRVGDVIVDSRGALEVPEVATAVRVLAVSGANRMPWLPPSWNPFAQGATMPPSAAWGGATAARSARRVLELLAEALDPESELVRIATSPDARRVVHAAKRELHGALRAYRVAEQARLRAERAALGAASREHPPLTAALEAAIASWAPASDRPDIGEACAALLTRAAESLRELASVIAPNADHEFSDALRDSLAGAAITDVEQRLLQVDVGWRAFAGSLKEEQAPDVRFRFMRLNAQPPVPFPTATDDPSALADPSAKLYGLQFGHFAGFIRSSWRANDWMWGRLDGASRMVDLLLADPYAREQRLTGKRLAEALAAPAAPALDELEKLPASILTPAVRNAIKLGRAPDKPVTPADLAAWRAVARHLLQRAIVAEELPEIGRAAREDEELRHFSATPGPLAPGAVQPDDAVDAFRAYWSALGADGGIPPRVAGELGSTAGTRLAADVAAVASRVVASPQAGFPGVLRGGLQSFAGLVRVGRQVARAITSPSPAVRGLFILTAFAAALALALSAESEAAATTSNAVSAKGGVTAIALAVLLVATIGGIVASPAGPRSRWRRVASGAAAFVTGLVIALGIVTLWVEKLPAPPDGDWCSRHDATPLARCAAAKAELAGARHELLWLVVVIAAAGLLVGLISTRSLGQILTPLGALVVAAALVYWWVWRGNVADFDPQKDAEILAGAGAVALVVGAGVLAVAARRRRASA